MKKLYNKPIAILVTRKARFFKIIRLQFLCEIFQQKQFINNMRTVLIATLLFFTYYGNDALSEGEDLLTLKIDGKR